MTVVGCSADHINQKRMPNGLVDDSNIHITDNFSANEMRQNLIELVWGNEGFPKDKQPSTVEAGDLSIFKEIRNLKRVDRLEVDMDYDFQSIAYLLHPNSDNGKYIIFHQGHSNNLGAYGGLDTIQELLDRGYTVLAFMMPLLGENSGSARNHDEIISLTKLNLPYDPIKFFLEPVAVARNYMRSNYNFEEAAMIGVSGGGWTTIVYSAIDPSVKLSIPVAGSLPLYLRKEERDIGDAEQYHTDFYEIAGYPDLYVLGAFGDGRKQIQILNRYDSCCFGGLAYEDYEEKVKNKLSELSDGHFEIFSDESHTNHLISERALNDVILPAIEDGKVGFSF